LRLYEQFMNFLFETYGDLYPMICVSDSRQRFKRWSPSLEDEEFVMAVMTGLCTVGVAFGMRLLGLRHARSASVVGLVVGCVCDSVLAETRLLNCSGGRNQWPALCENGLNASAFQSKQGQCKVD
jgi:hypothetical protein